MSTQYPNLAPVEQRPAGIATASLVLGIVGFFIGICAVIGLVMSIVARGKAKRGEISWRRVQAGFVVSLIATILTVLWWGYMLSN